MTESIAIPFAGTVMSFGDTRKYRPTDSQDDSQLVAISSFSTPVTMRRSFVWCRRAVRSSKASLQGRLGCEVRYKPRCFQWRTLSTSPSCERTNHPLNRMIKSTITSSRLRPPP